MEARYRYRLRVNEPQARALQEVFNCCRFVWNTALGRWSDLWRHEHVNLSEADMHAELTDWRSRFDWRAAVPVTPQQQAIIDLGRSIRAFFDKKNPAGRPRFKKKVTHASARWTLRGFSLRGDRLSVAFSGGRVDLRVVWSRPLPTAPKSVTIYRDAAGRFWASFVVRVAPEEIGATGQTTGLDVGLATFATTEFPDADVATPGFARRAAKALARSQRNMARKQKGSKNRAKAKRRVAKVHATVAAKRGDFMHKEARALARRFDVIGVEDLKIKNMLGNRHLARSISDAGWGRPVATDLFDTTEAPGTVYLRSDATAVDDVQSVLAATANPDNPDQVEVSRPSDAIEARAAASNAFTSLLLGLGAVALLVGGVGIANVMVISVLERRSEIGLRRALGATRRHVGVQFLSESLLLSGIGGLGGVLVGAAVTAVYAASRGWQIVVPGIGLAGGFLAAAGIGAIAGLYPALRAARLAPTEALRTV